VIVASIPRTAHFIWFGRELLWVHLLAMRSAAVRGGFGQVILHHADELRDSPWWGEVEAIPGFEARRLEPEALLESCPRGGELIDVFRALNQPAGKANVVRAAVLFAEGGVFLDSDTVTVAPFQSLLVPGGAFCGQERITKPLSVKVDRALSNRISLFLRRYVRAALRELPGGWRGFRRIERWYPAAVNNAVLGCEPGHRLMGNLLEGMVLLPRERRTERYALGTHLLQRTVAAYRDNDLRILPPPVFYPLGPEISIHWFRESHGAPLDEVLQPDTILVHWYASVRTRGIVPAINPDYVRAHAGTQLFSALALPFLES
jgi:Glycosyltransferase sugar-binding region containing DXD motif